MSQDRRPIVLNSDAVALIQIYTHTSDVMDIWKQDLDLCIQNDPYAAYVDAAKELINQLEEHWCFAFMEALVSEIRKTIEKWPEDECFKNLKKCPFCKKDM